jgi:cation diffusion facilitator CzcD-associated flavoprotein CzcO
VGSEELLDYFKGRAKAYGMWEFLRLQHQVVGAKWDNEAGQWEVEVEDIMGGRKFTDKAEILLNATGFLKYVFIPTRVRGHIY